MNTVTINGVACAVREDGVVIFPNGDTSIPMVRPHLTEEAMRAIKAEAHKLWFDALNPYCDHLGIYPEVDPKGVEKQTVTAFVQQILDPLIDNHQQLVREVTRLRVELAARGPRLAVVGDEPTPPERPAA